MRKIPSLPYERWGKVSPGEVAGIVHDGGPVFMTYGEDTVAVLISRNKWRTLNHNVPSVDPHNAQVNFVGGQAYMVIPVVDLGSGIWQATPETGLKIITCKRSKPK